jgi:hypothetical protein
MKLMSNIFDKLLNDAKKESKEHEISRKEKDDVIINKIREALQLINNNNGYLIANGYIKPIEIPKILATIVINDLINYESSENEHSPTTVELISVMASHFSREFFQMLNQYLYEKFEVMKEDDEDDEEECEECGSTLCKKEIVSGMRKNIKRLGL